MPPFEPREDARTAYLRQRLANRANAAATCARFGRNAIDEVLQDATSSVTIRSWSAKTGNGDASRTRNSTFRAVIIVVRRLVGNAVRRCRQNGRKFALAPVMLWWRSP